MHLTTVLVDYIPNSFGSTQHDIELAHFCPLRLVVQSRWKMWQTCQKLLQHSSSWEPLAGFKGGLLLGQGREGRGKGLSRGALIRTTSHWLVPLAEQLHGNNVCQTFHTVTGRWPKTSRLTATNIDTHWTQVSDANSN